MDYCKYHPLTAATYYCDACDTKTCDTCCDDEKIKLRCFSCSKQLESLGAVNYARPFWRRLEESFRYPLKTQPLS